MSNSLAADAKETREGENVGNPEAVHSVPALKWIRVQTIQLSVRLVGVKVELPPCRRRGGGSTSSRL